MKKALVIMLTSAVMMAAVACGSNNTSAPAAEAPAEEAQAEETTQEVETEVMEETEDEGPLVPEDLPCTEKEYELMEIGKFIKVKGYKAEWSGEVEVIDATWMFEDGEYIAEPEDVTALLGTDELINKQNKYVCFRGVKVEPAGEDTDAAFLYNWDGSGSEGDDLYFNVSVNGQTYSFTVESYLCGPDSDIYKAVKDFKVGDVIDLVGFLYWYEGPNPHITGILAQ